LAYLLGQLSKGKIIAIVSTFRDELEWLYLNFIKQKSTWRERFNTDEVELILSSKSG
jgi:hypothetical protein